MRRRLLCACLLAVLAACAGGVDPTSARRPPCGNDAGYGYAGLQSLRRAHGVRAAITALAPPYVAAGHVAAWIGVGGAGQGPRGADEWLQVGLAGFASSRESKLYYEVAQPGRAPVYTQVLEGVEAGRRVDVAVLEMARRPGYWRVWVDGAPVSEPIHLPRVGPRWRPVATAETWDGGRGSCNGFGYGFDRVRVAATRGGSWRRFRTGARWADPGYRVVQQRRSGFRALATTVPVWRPGWWDARAAAPPTP